MAPVNGSKKRSPTAHDGAICVISAQLRTKGTVVSFKGRRPPRACPDHPPGRFGPSSPWRWCRDPRPADPAWGDRSAMSDSHGYVNRNGGSCPSIDIVPKRVPLPYDFTRAGFAASDRNDGRARTGGNRAALRAPRSIDRSSEWEFLVRGAGGRAARRSGSFLRQRTGRRRAAR